MSSAEELRRRLLRSSDTSQEVRRLTLDQQSLWTGEALDELETIDEFDGDDTNDHLMLARISAHRRKMREEDES